MELSNLTLRCSGGAKQPPSDSFGENVSMNDSPIVNEDTTQPTQDERYADVEERARRYNISAEMICLTDYLESRTRVQLSSFHSADDRFETLGRAVGVQKEGENIFVVLTRFEYTMHAKSVHMDDYLSVLPLVLSGTFREAYVNNVNGCVKMFECFSPEILY